MSLTVLFIAAAHTIPVFLAASTGNKGLVTIAAIVMTLIAIFTGGGAYVAIDLFMVGLAYFACMQGK